MIRESVFIICFFIVYINVVAQEFQLANPILEFGEVLFQDEVNIQAELRIKGSTIRYTLDGSEVTEGSDEFETVITCKSDCTLKARAFHKDFVTSNTVQQTFRKLEESKIQSISIEEDAHENYKADGSSTLFDGKKGSSDFQDGRWLGFQGQDVTLDLDLSEELSYLDVKIGYLINKDAWIFGPGVISVYGLLSEEKEQILGTFNLGQVGEKDLPINDFYELRCNPRSAIKKVRIEVKRFEKIPDWHPGDKTNTWIFLDEIIVR